MKSKLQESNLKELIHHNVTPIILAGLTIMGIVKTYINSNELARNRELNFQFGAVQHYLRHITDIPELRINNEDHELSGQQFTELYYYLQRIIEETSTLQDFNLSVESITILDKIRDSSTSILGIIRFMTYDENTILNEQDLDKTDSEISNLVNEIGILKNELEIKQVNDLNNQQLIDIIISLSLLITLLLTIKQIIARKKERTRREKEYLEGLVREAEREIFSANATTENLPEDSIALGDLLSSKKSTTKS